MAKASYIIKSSVRSIVPDPILGSLLAGYHLALAYFGAWFYGFPSRHIAVFAVTGTKGKSSTVEMLNAIFEEAGEKTALVNSIRFKVGDKSTPNTTRMSMPGRFFLQSFLARAVKEGCTIALLEMTSEGARQYRHRAIELDALIFTNLAPEHIESHGSLQAYADAKFAIGQALARSSKRPRSIIVNADDREAPRYLALPLEERLPFSLESQKPFEADEHGGYFTLNDTRIALRLPGEFSLRNALGAATLARARGIPVGVIARALEKMGDIPWRAQRIEAGQDFTVVVDYAHTPDSLRALYDAYSHARKICVLGATGGGRDTWKRPVMGGVADELCDTVILTNEDPYDEDPLLIVDGLRRGMKRQPTVIMDRRAAIAHGLSLAKTGDSVLITGKGTDPTICGPRGKSEPWSDAAVAREEIERLRATL